MVSLLAKLLIKDRDNTANEAVRRAYGSLCGCLGICLNILLFALKYFAGILSGSIAITADAFNNLSDAGSSVITLVGFHLAGKKPDPGHPFGHGRVEYLAGLAVSAIIIIMGVELLRSSAEKIIHPEPIEAGILPAAILLLSIAVKLYMCYYNRSVGRKISSAAMSAVATDSLTDAVATTVVLISMGIAYFAHVNIDAYAGVAVACFIIFSGCGAARDTISPLLGQPPEDEFVQQIRDIAMSCPVVLGIHDLIVHDYGPGRVMISLHAEVDGAGDIFQLHEAIDKLEHELGERLDCMATVHMDPIAADDDEVSRLRQAVGEKLKELDGALTIHDFRLIPGANNSNLVFDAVVPYDLKLTDEQAQQKIKEIVAASFPGCTAVVNIDRSYV